MVQTISALVENKPGVLAKMAEAFSSQDLNIKSISCGETEKPEISRMVICIDSGEIETEGEKSITNVTEFIGSLDFVISVDDLARKEFVDRELALIKVDMEPETTAQLMQIFEIFRADVVGMGNTTITAEITGDKDRVDGLIKMLTPFGIKSMCRTGMIALKRGDE
ncbi:MAG: acetolactate synthase small subunit [Desulfovibrio sp.]